MRLQIITPYFNPMGYKNRLLRYLEFERHMLESGVELTTVECNRGLEPHILKSNSIRHIPVSAKTICWQKESQMQIAYKSLPSNCEFVGWFDGDLKFENPNWVHDALVALEDHDIVSAWEYCNDLDADGNIAEVHESFGKVVKTRRPIIQGAGSPEKFKNKYRFAHPGYAWIARKSFLDAVGGFIDTAILGSGDQHMALSILGRVHESADPDITADYMEPIFEWQEKCLKYQPKVGFVPGVITHGYHGAKKNRAYAARWKILIKHKFDPKTDLVFNEFGLVELAGNKPELNADIELYFHQRAEDE